MKQNLRISILFYLSALLEEKKDPEPIAAHKVKAYYKDCLNKGMKQCTCRDSFG